MHAVTTLPSGYRSSRTITLAHNSGLFIGLNLAGFVLFVAFGLLFLFLAAHLSPAFTMNGSGTLSGWGLLIIPGVLIASFPFTMIVHELIHGLFFWIFTRKRPSYGFKGLYAYAAAPDFYIPRNQFILIGLAPFVVMSLVGIALLPFTSLGVALTIVLILTMNAAGAVGDFYVVGVLLAQAPSTMIRDFGDGMAFYRPE
jgi:hypothetical protein